MTASTGDYRVALVRSPGMTDAERQRRLTAAFSVLFGDVVAFGCDLVSAPSGSAMSGGMVDTLQRAARDE